MARPATNTFKLSDGRVVGYGLTDRGGSWRVRFTGPDGKRWEESTGHEDKNKAIVRAAQIILKAFSPAEVVKAAPATWAEAMSELSKTAGLRPDSLRNYRCAVNVFRREVSDTTGPADVTTQHGLQFKRKAMQRKTVKGQGDNRKEVPTSAVTVTTYLRSLRSLWSVHFRDMGVVASNPWADVPYPETTSKPVSIPTEDHFKFFTGWLDERYPNWSLPSLFVRVKALAGCRTADLCQVTSDNVKDGTLTITANADKTHRQRTVPLPADVFDQLEAIKGETYLWESFTQGAKANRRGSRTRNPETFTPDKLKNAMQNIFREYREEHPDKTVKAHDFRKRAVTLTTLATGGNVDESSLACGVTPQTARRYYNDSSKSSKASDLLAKMAGVLDTVTKPSPNVTKPRTPSNPTETPS